MTIKAEDPFERECREAAASFRRFDALARSSAPLSKGAASTLEIAARVSERCADLARRIANIERNDAAMKAAMERRPANARS